MTLEQLWSGWRRAYVAGAIEQQRTLVARTDVDAVGVDGADQANGSAEPPGEGSLFERILASGLADDETYVVRRGRRCSALLNIYPYTNGHLLVLPDRAVPDLADLDDEEHTELWSMVRDATAALRLAFGCDGVNVGANLGLAAGAGVPDHLHVHVLPRWSGDTNFMTTVANTRVLPVALDDTWAQLRVAWPQPC